MLIITKKKDIPKNRFADWYANPANRLKLNARRRSNYKGDKKYRKRVLETSRRWREKTADQRALLPPKPKTLFRIGEVAESLGCDQKTLRTLEKQGLIPGKDKGPTHRRYTKKQIALIQPIVMLRKEFDYRHPEYKPKLKKLSSQAHTGW